MTVSNTELWRPGQLTSDHNIRVHIKVEIVQNFEFELDIKSTWEIKFTGIFEVERVDIELSSS